MTWGIDTRCWDAIDVVVGVRGSRGIIFDRGKTWRVGLGLVVGRYGHIETHVLHASREVRFVDF